MSVETRIPIASKERWASLSTKEEKDKFVQQYDTWKKSPFTRELIKYYEAQLIKETEMHDKEQGFFSCSLSDSQKQCLVGSALSCVNY